MQTLDRDELSSVIPAPADVLYRLVADVTRTPELSPEITRCAWLDGGGGAVPGARFEATNTVNGKSWKNRPVVLVADPGREFAFARTERFAGTVEWRYRFAPVPGGTLVTESYEVTRPVSRLGWFVIERVFGSGERRVELRAGMEETLRRLAELAREELAREEAAARTS